MAGEARAERSPTSGRGDSLPVLGARGVVRLQALAERQQLRLLERRAEAAGAARAEPAHAPAGLRGPRGQRAGPRRVAPDRPPHQVAHCELPRAPLRDLLALLAFVLTLRIYRSRNLCSSSSDNLSSFLHRESVTVRSASHHTSAGRSPLSQRFEPRRYSSVRTKYVETFHMLRFVIVLFNILKFTDTETYKTSVTNENNQFF